MTTTHKIELINVQTLHARCGHGYGKTREEAIEDALRRAREASTDGKAWYDQQRGAVCFCGGINC